MCALVTQMLFTRPSRNPCRNGRLAARRAITKAQITKITSQQNGSTVGEIANTVPIAIASPNSDSPRITFQFIIRLSSVKPYSRPRLRIPCNARNFPPPVAPARAVENLRRHLDEPREGVEDSQRRPRLSVTHAATGAVQLVGHVLHRDVLDDQLHHRVQRARFLWILFEMQAVAGHAQSERHFVQRARIAR